MHRIDDPSAVNAVPTPLQQGTPGYFSDGSPTIGEEATIVRADWANAVQEEIANVIEQAGITLSKTDRTQLLQAIAKLTRLRLTAPITFYVSPAGNDASDGLTQATAWASITHAYNYIRDRIDLNGFQSTIQLMDGTYASATLQFACVGPAPLIQGNTGDPTRVIVNGVSGPAIAATAGAQVVCSDFTVEATGPQGDYGAVGSGLLASTGGLIIIRSGMNFGACSYSHIAAYAGGNISAAGSGVVYTIAGSAPQHVLIDSGGVSIADANISIAAGVAFSSGYVYALNGASTMDGWGCVWTGTATGPRYSIHYNAVVHGNGGANYFPGNAAGVADTGGIYT
jgi:hypothetical protein